MLERHGELVDPQSIERAVSVLRVIASRGRRGMRIAEVVATAGLAHATCFRMLQCLQAEGLVDKDAHTRKYYLGPLVHELGLLARPRYRLSELCDGALRQLADSLHTEWAQAFEANQVREGYQPNAAQALVNDIDLEVVNKRI